ncbi:hypothetical protein GmHk_19G054342 [Glycine max]|nr:hypothetical protein GmHk_19G054342 [Glycine max]
MQSLQGLGLPSIMSMEEFDTQMACPRDQPSSSGGSGASIAQEPVTEEPPAPAEEETTPDHTPQPSPSSASTPKETQPSALDHNEDHHRRSRTRASSTEAGFKANLFQIWGRHWVKKRLSHEVPKVTVELSSADGLSVHPPLSAASACLHEGESGRASASRSHAKHEIIALSIAGVFSQAQCTTGAKPEPSYPH